MNSNKKSDSRKFKCTDGNCRAQLPEVYCERVMIQRREIPRFIELLDALGDDTVLSYHILPPTTEDKKENREMDRTWIFIWVDPRKHHDPEYLVKAAANVACGFCTMKEEVDFIKENGYHDELYRQTCRELNCPVCVKNHLKYCKRAMTHGQYLKSLAANAGIRD